LCCQNYLVTFSLSQRCPTVFFVRWPFDNIFCGERTCTQVVENQLMFEDGDHLTPQGSLLLVSQLEEKMTQLITP
jgi:hypothetical protein